MTQNAMPELNTNTQKKINFFSSPERSLNIALMIPVVRKNTRRVGSRAHMHNDAGCIFTFLRQTTPHEFVVICFECRGDIRAQCDRVFDLRVHIIIARRELLMAKAADAGGEASVSMHTAAESGPFAGTAQTRNGGMPSLGYMTVPEILPGIAEGSFGAANKYHAPATSAASTMANNSAYLNTRTIIADMS